MYRCSSLAGVAFFDTDFTQTVRALSYLIQSYTDTVQMCQRFYLFEPITTAILLACCSFVHVLRVYAIHDQNRMVLGIMSALLAVQIVVTGICCGFYRCERLFPFRVPPFPWLASNQ